MDIPSNSNTDISSDIYKFLNEYAINPAVLLIVSVVLIIYFVLFSSLGMATGSSDNSQQPGKVKLFLEILLWSLFVILLLLNGIYYIFNINVVASIKIYSVLFLKLILKTNQQKIIYQK